MIIDTHSQSYATLKQWEVCVHLVTLATVTSLQWDSIMSTSHDESDNRNLTMQLWLYQQSQLFLRISRNDLLKIYTCHNDKLLPGMYMYAYKRKFGTKENICKLKIGSHVISEKIFANGTINSVDVKWKGLLENLQTSSKTWKSWMFFHANFPLYDIA